MSLSCDRVAQPCFAPDLVDRMAPLVSDVLMGGVSGEAVFDLVILDCDGVLVDSEPISARVLLSALAELGIQVDLAHFRRYFLGRSFPRVAEDIRRDFGVTLPAEFEEVVRSRMRAAFARELHTTPGLLTMLDRITVPTAVASSSTLARVRLSLTVTGLWERFEDRIFTASEVPRGKPAPDLFLHAAARMGVAPGRCLVVEDSRPGLEAARAAGMAALHYAGGSHLTGHDVGVEASLGQIAHWSEFPARCPGLFAEAVR